MEKNGKYGNPETFEPTFCALCERMTSISCRVCPNYGGNDSIEPEDHEDDWYNETHEDADFWDDFEGGIFLDDEKEGDES